MNVVVLTGGSTPERDVALAGAGQVVAALRNNGHQVVAIDTTYGPLSHSDEKDRLHVAVPTEPPDDAYLADLRTRELGPGLLQLEEITDADVVFPVLHGAEAEGGSIQAMLDSAGIAYTGSGPLGSGMAMDKDIAKRLFRAAGIQTPDWHLWPCSKEEINALGFPVVVKPSKVGSTVGLTVVNDPSGIERAVINAAAYDDEVILETFVSGPELTVGILGAQALAVGEIRPAHEIFDYECKYTPGMCQEIFPAPISDGVSKRAQEIALKAHNVLKLRDYSRVDFRIGANETIHCLEANTLPGLTPTSLLPQSAAAAGFSFEQLCERIVDAAFKRAARRNNVPNAGIKK